MSGAISAAMLAVNKIGIAGLPALSTPSSRRQDANTMPPGRQGAQAAGTSLQQSPSAAGNSRAAAGGNSLGGKEPSGMNVGRNSLLGG